MSMSPKRATTPTDAAKPRTPRSSRSPADSRPAFVSVRPQAWEMFASGMSLRAVARAQGLHRWTIESWAKQEGWKAERDRLRAAASARATAQATKSIEARLTEVKRLGIDVRIAGLKRTKRAIGRRRIDGAEAAAIRDLSTAAKNLDLQAEAARAPSIDIDNRHVIGVSLAEMLEESRKFDIPRLRDASHPQALPPAGGEA